MSRFHPTRPRGAATVTCLRALPGGIVFFIVLGFSITAQQNTGSVHGTVLDAATLKPVPAALVTANRSGAPPFTRNTRSGGDGAFQIQGLVCAHALGFLDSCRWGLARAVPKLAAAEARQLAAISLAPAAEVVVQVNDPASVLPKQDGANGSGLILGVKDPGGAFWVAPPTITTTGRTYLLSVPFDRSFSLRVYSRAVQLADSQGNALPSSGGSIPLRVNSGAKPTPLTITVTGAR